VDNPDFIPIALFQLGGDTEFVDVEDIFVRCYELAPDRFGWRTHDLPNYKTVSKALRDFEARNPGLLLKTADGLRRQLSAAGIEWLRDRLPSLEQTLVRVGRNPATRRPSQRILNELAENPLVRAFESGERPELVKYQVADALACVVDSPASVWRERLETYRAAATAGRRPNLLRFLEYVEDEHPEWFGGKTK
jgi:hypothetical protein